MLPNLKANVMGRILWLLASWLLLSCSNELTPIPAPPLLTPTPTVASAAPVRSNSDLTAIITQVRGDVTIIDGASASRPIRPMQIVQADVVLRLAANAQVGLICVNEHWVQLSGSGTNEWQVNEQNCQHGRLLATGAYQSVVPKKGRIVDLAGSLLIAERTREREGDYGNIPVILSPRHTILVDLQPKVQWTAVEGAIEYQLNLSGLAAFDTVVLDVVEGTCATEADIVGNRTCTVAWPIVWTLEPGQHYFLTISARTSIAAPLRKSESSALRTLPDEAAKAVQREATNLQTFALDSETQTMLSASLYAKQELYAQAIPLYEQLLLIQPDPAVYIALGDLYRAIDLQRYAFNAYQHALDQLDQGEDDLPMRAAAEFGLGQVYFVRQVYKEAQNHYGIAKQIYEQIRSEAELQAAQTGFEEATARLP